jgi:phage shock protein PspC (stress-responsive transcriptional regulator)
MEKKLYRIKNGKVLAGVCGGVAEYFKIDPTIVRVLWVLASLVGFAGVLAYIACAFIIPEKPDDIIDV